MKSNKQALIDIASCQGGYFSARQAVQAGVHQQNHHRFVQSGEWIRIFRSVYRFSFLPEQNFGECFAVALFFGGDEFPSAVFAIESALMIRGIGDFLPPKHTLAVVPGNRIRSELPGNVTLEKEIAFGNTDFDLTMGFPVMKALPTIAHMLALQSSEEHLVKAAFLECRRRGEFSAKALSDFLESATSDKVKEQLRDWESEFSLNQK